jgi:hypothetical protein
MKAPPSPQAWPARGGRRPRARPAPRAAGDWLVCVANTNVHTYEAAPVFTLVERAALARLAACVGPAWASAHDGLFVPGGSIGTLYGAATSETVRRRATCASPRSRRSKSVLCLWRSAAHRMAACVSPALDATLDGSPSMGTFTTLSLGPQACTWRAL